jgi:hypothetical protein
MHGTAFAPTTPPSSASSPAPVTKRSARAVIRRRFSHQSTRDLSALSEFVDTEISDAPDDHKSPDERAEILATPQAKLRPELDLYLMTEIEVEDIAGRLGQHFRRVFHARDGALELHLSILEGVAARYRSPALFRAQAIQPPADWCLHALPISRGKSIVVVGAYFPLFPN